MTPMLNLSFFTGGIAQTNGWLLQTEAGALVFDAPEGMTGWLRQRGVRVAALILTHQHFDHVQDAAALKAEHACPIYAFAAYSRTLTLEDLFGVATGMSVSVPPYTVDHLLEGQSTLTGACSRKLSSRVTAPVTTSPPPVSQAGIGSRIRICCP